MDTKNVIARFEAERQALALMDHPNIAHVLDAGATESGRPYFVMELVRGAKITDYCDQSRMPTADRLELFIQVCNAVQHAHQKGIIHRDIKPSNILVTTSAEGKPLPKVIDFGIAKATTGLRLTDKTLFTAFEMLIGTPAYMSPEQAALTSLGVDTRTDVYSLGVLLYELLTGTTPFDTKALLKSGLDEIRRVIREEDPAPPSTRLSRMKEESLTVVAQHRSSEPPRLIRTICGDLDWIVMKALEKDRARRYETAYGLSLDVKRLLENEAVSARPPSRLYKFQKAVQRNRLLSVGIGILATLLVAGLIVVSASLSQERQSRREAKQVKQFLEEMLQGVGPDVALGRDTAILREILDQAAARVGKELTNQSAVEAELRGVIGTLYFRTGQFHQAEEMQRAALAIRRNRFGSESPETAASLNELGLTLVASGKLSEAEQVNREALDIRRRRFGNENADVATSEDHLAHVYTQNGKLAEAEALARESLATRQNLSGNDSLEAAESLRTLAVIMGDKQQWAKAETMMRKVLELRRKKLGPEHPWVASALNDVAWAAGGNGKQKEAEALEQEALTMRQKLLSPEHPDVAVSLYRVGDRMRQLGNLKEAYPVLNAALSIQRKVLGDNHPDTLYTLKSMGLLHEAEHQWPEAETVFREVLAAWRERAGNDDLETIYALRNLASVLGDQGKWPEAETLYREELAFWRKRGGDSDPEAPYTLHSLGAAVSAQGKWPQAEKIYREELALQRKRAGNDDPNTLYALRDLGEILECEGKWAEAVSAHREELALWRKQAGNDDPQTLYALDKLGWALEGVGKWSEAESVYREALASRRNHAGNDDPQTLSEYDSLTSVLMHEKEFSETEKILAEALTTSVIQQPSNRNLLIRRLELMGRQGRWQEAAAAASLIVESQPTDEYPYHSLAALLAITQNRPAYEILCRKIVATFTNTSNPYVDERIAKDCLFLPDSGVDLEFVDKLADKSVSLGSGHLEAFPYFQVAKAMSAYRMGRSAEAIEWAEKTLRGTIIYPDAHAYAILAMADWQLGRKDAARVALAKGDSLTPKISPTNEAVDLGDSWVAWLEARISLDEAGQLIPLNAETK
jgi:tetratricopeptide (TPR) repeat protein